jgi:hypothetical protein
MPSPEYHLKQAKVAEKLALTEPDPVRAASLLVLALEHYEKAAKAKDAKLRTIGQDERENESA